MRIIVLILLTVFCTIVLGKNKQEWKSRTIYQLLTDRFYRGNGDTSPCPDLKKYCGGTFSGIKKQLPYIKQLGFDAIWISPIPENQGDDYHGYGAINFYEVNQHFGTKEELKDLVEECHRNDIWVMLDVVANHVACVWEDFSRIYPFNRPEHYHDKCDMDWNKIWENRWMREHCRFFCMPDLNQDNPWVRSELKKWIKYVIDEYKFDGLRIDTVIHVQVDFWKEFAEAAGVFQTGEVMQDNSPLAAEYQHYLDSITSYPMYDCVWKIFHNRGSMYQIRTRLTDIHSNFPDPAALTNFLDNHDKPRFLEITKDLRIFRNALVFILFVEGIPVVYYGSEQAFKGGDDPWNRQPLWTNMDPNSEMYKFIQKTLEVRKRYDAGSAPHIERYVDNPFYIWTRGAVLICITNTDQQISVTVGYHNFPVGTRLCNIYDTRDCVNVESNGIQINLNGEPKVYVHN